MKGPVNAKLAQRLRELREHSKLSQHAVTKAIGTAHQTISQYEKAAIHIPIERAAEMMRVMGFALRHLTEEGPGAPLPPIKFQPRQKAKTPTLIQANDRFHYVANLLEGVTRQIDRLLDLR